MDGWTDVWMEEANGWMDGHDKSLILAYMRI